MSSEPFLVCAETPLWSLTHGFPEQTNLGKVFHHWPVEKQQLLMDAQNARDLILEHLKQEGASMELRLQDVDRYLPLALAIEKEKNSNAKITVDKDERIRWRQTPIVVSKYVDRSFSGDYWGVEVLHVIWLRAIELLNNGFVLYKANELEASIKQFREVAGVFHFLASDRLRCPGSEALPKEFQAPVFNSLMTLSLAQAYALIASKGELDGLQNSALGKLCYTVSATYGSALDAIIESKLQDKVIHMQYVNWLIGTKAYYHACAAFHLGLSAKQKGAIGRAVAFIRCAITDLSGIGKLDKHNKRLAESADRLLKQAKALEGPWAKENFDIMAEVVPTPEETERIITEMCVIMPNLPQPVPFTLPEPAQYEGAVRK